MTVKEGKFVESDIFKADAETYHVLQTLVEAKKEQLKDLNRVMGAETAKLTQLQQDARNAHKVLERELEDRRRAFEAELYAERQAAQRELSDVTRVQEELTRQTREAKQLLDQGEAIRQEANDLIARRMEMERQQIQFDAAKAEAEQKIIQAADDAASASAQREAITKQQQELKLLQQTIQTAQDTLTEKETAAQTRLEQVQTIKREIDPKLAELAEKQTVLNEQEIRVKTLQREAQEQIGLNAQTAANLEGTRQQLDARLTHCQETEARLKVWEQELTRKETPSA